MLIDVQLLLMSLYIDQVWLKHTLYDFSDYMKLFSPLMAMGSIMTLASLIFFCFAISTFIQQGCKATIGWLYLLFATIGPLMIAWVFYFCEYNAAAYQMETKRNLDLVRTYRDVLIGMTFYAMLIYLLFAVS